MHVQRVVNMCVRAFCKNKERDVIFCKSDGRLLYTVEERKSGEFRNVNVFAIGVSKTALCLVM